MAEAAADRQLMTAEEFAALPDNGLRRELVRGEVIEMAPAGEEHGSLGMKLSWRLAAWVESHRLGRTFLAETGFLLSRQPDHVLAPDAAFTRQERLPEQPVRGWSEVVPDLVLEVVSPSERLPDVLAKVADWLAAGVQVVWVLWPAKRLIHVWDGDDIALLHETDTLTCEHLLPGFAVPLAELFAP